VYDEFSRDPAVLRMRRIFGKMEAAQAGLLAAAGVPRFDERLRYCRERARLFFERAWSCASRSGQELAEEEAGALYALCFARMLVGEGVPIPEGALPEAPALARLLREVFP